MRVAVDRMGLEAARRPRAPEETRRADILNRSRQWDSVRSDRDVFIVGLVQMETNDVGRSGGGGDSQIGVEVQLDVSSCRG